MPEAVVVLLGGGAEFEATRERARDTGVLDMNCFILESVTKQQVAAWFRACDVAVSTFVDLPGLQANSPNKVFDALAAGRPVAVNNGGWMADILTRTGAGMSLPPGSPSEAARLLAAFLADSTRIEAAQHAARRLADTEFNRDVLFSKFEKVILEARK
jgi:glycosyltransferase involved in cell wall biosynthesis